ncbi:MAG: glycoside hydrolase family 78 protein [Prevotellaceae bacterium]|jgi:hypothetical protein|nr:glycoside hydrolase family 78 protein [Prevotellaceae bacterium]
MTRFYRTIFLFATLAGSFFAQAMEVKNPTCEMLQNPMGISASQVRFGWQLTSFTQGDRQTAYRIIVSSSKANAEKKLGNVWDSHEVKSGKSQLVSYGGKKLKAGERYYWRVMARDVAGQPSAWSSVQQLDVAPVINEVNVRWIGAIKKADSHLPEGKSYTPPFKKHGYDTLFAKVDTLAKRSIMLRKNFDISKKTIKRAMVYVSGLGSYELSINGKRVGSSIFAPAWSDYDKTIYYNIYNVDTLLSAGANAVGVLLGNGFYNEAELARYHKLLRSFGPPTLFFRMEVDYTDGTSSTVISDNTWKFSPSPITYNSIYGGEDYNALLEQDGWDTPEFDDSTWLSAVVQESPTGRLRAQLMPSVKVMQQYDVKHVIAPKKNAYVLDMGQNLSGFPTIKVQGKAGQVVRIYPAESLTKDSLADQKKTGSPHYYQYTLRGDSVEEWSPRFSYYGYQYLQVENVDLWRDESRGKKPVLLDVVSNFIYASVEETGEFESSNEIFNRTHWLINNAMKSNMQAVFTDCPQREKLGWLEQTHLNGPGLFYNYNLAQFFPKSMQDMADGQYRTGLVPSTVPQYTDLSVWGEGFVDSPEWGGAAVIVPFMYYQYYGDSTLIVRYFDVMRRYVDYLSRRAEGHILSHGLGDWYDYGDFRAGLSRNTPVSLVATAHYYYLAKLTAQAAAMLGKENYEEKYTTLAKNIRWAFNTKFFDSDSKQYGTGSQTSNAIPLFMNIVEPQNRDAVLLNIVKDVQAHGNRLTTGDVGNRYLFQSLARNGYNDVMYAMHNHYDVPGYGFQLKFGLSTLTEQWDPRHGASMNHFMLGQIEEWFFHTLAGIAPDEKRPGFQHFRIAPVPVGDLTHVNASYNSLYGKIKVNWTTENSTFTLKISVPVNTTATVALPYAEGVEIMLDGAPIETAGNVKILTQGSILVGSGQYTFSYSEK